MSKIVGVSSLLLLFILTACSSPEAKELIEYHNSYIEVVNKKVKEVDELLVKSEQAPHLGEAYSIQKEEVKPVIDEIIQYIQQQNPETDVVKNLNQMRVKQFNTWLDAFEIRLKALEIAKNTSEDNPEVAELMKQYEGKLVEANNLATKANEKVNDLINEYNLEVEEQN